MCFPWNRYYLVYTSVEGDFFYGHVHTLDCCLITTRAALIATELVTLVGNINTVSYNFNAPILVTSASHIITTTLLLTVKLLFAIQLFEATRDACWRYFAAKKWNELANDIRIKAGTNEVKNKIRLLNKFWLKSGFIVIAECFFLLLFNRFLPFYSFHMMNYCIFLVFSFKFL